MAALTRGVSFRRQGSSGLSWTDSWSFNEEGELVRSTKEEAAEAAMAMMTGNECSGSATCGNHVRFAGSFLARIHDLQEDDDDCEPKTVTDSAPDSNRSCSSAASDQHCPHSSAFSRSKSVGSSLATSVFDVTPQEHNTPSVPPRKGSAHLLKWLKKRFSKTRK